MIQECTRLDCSNEASDLSCPVCIVYSDKAYFCSQDCFRLAWKSHKATHYDPWPVFKFTGPLRPGKISPRREVNSDIISPDYAVTGVPKSELSFKARMAKPQILSEKEIEGMRTVGRMAREVLNIAASHIKVGVTTDYIDEIVHQECMRRKAYPSPLNYSKFPKSLCTSVNEVICHGIPDSRRLQDGDIVNLDVTLYYGGFHGDLNETYYVGNAKSNPDAVRVVETARQCLELAIKEVKPGVPFRKFGDIIEAHATKNNCSVIKTYVGHGVNSLFHTAPNIPHYAKNKAIGTCRKGMTFTIEPMIALGDWRDIQWPDQWTAVTADGKLTAQFEQTLLVTEDGVEVLTKDVRPVENENPTSEKLQKLDLGDKN